MFTPASAKSSKKAVSRAVRDRNATYRAKLPASHPLGDRRGGAAGVQLHHLHLQVAGGLRLRRQAGPATLRVELPGVRVVGEASVEHVGQLVLQDGLID